MKKFILGALSVLFIVGCNSKSTPADVILTFDVENPLVKEVVIVRNTDIQTFKLDENGHGEAVFDGVSATYAQLYYGREGKMIYMEAGDRATISFDATDFSSTFAFEGPKSPAVTYLNNVVLTPLPDESFSLDFNDFKNKLANKEDDALKLLEASKITGAGDFVEMEKARIRYSYATPLLMYPVGHMLMAQDPDYKPSEEYYQSIEPYFVAEPDLLCLNEYRNFIIEASHSLDDENRNVTDLNPKTVAQMRFIADRFEDYVVVENLLHYLATSYIDTFGIDGIEEMESIYKTYVKDEKKLADYAQKYDKWNVSKPGRPSPALEASDVDGKVWTLDDFKGKYVYIDLWATWCNPCKRELPYLVQLEEKFAGANIVFVGLSTDGNKENWEKMVRNGMPGVQLYLGPRSSFQQAYNVQGIPRFILLDKEGKIISNDMSRPSSDETVQVLESLDGIRE